MLITHLAAAGCAAAAICLGRSEYEKKALSVEETTLYSSKVSQGGPLSFCPTFTKIPSDLKMNNCSRPLIP